MKEKSKISVISKAVEEPVELEFWGKRNGIDQFRVKSIAGRNETGKIKLLELWNCIPFEK